ncbi:hypothetical protein J7I94_18120 [Streptomyces sp. ISL-12]|uniref:hypothetical protein n=1 Tax=Streptomyces sp. ISL-12 TaxID=2819177 RepID=UPI001BE87593|nr:hypothetical protein [Streptomyces sp. ISL-12]MBT2412459.1 hypothetical protein [Streptomyces sp. ISL-12]
MKRLPHGKAKVTATAGRALSTIGNVGRALNHLDGQTATTYVVTRYRTSGNPNVPSGTYLGSTAGRSANGGLLRRASGGPAQHSDQGGYIQSPSTGTSDSICATCASGAESMVSNTEYVMTAAAVRKYGVKMMDALNEGRLPIAHLAKGGLSRAAKDARGQLRDLLVRRMAGYQRTPSERSLGAPSDISSLVSALNQVAGQIRVACAPSAPWSCAWPAGTRPGATGACTVNCSSSA